MRKSENKENDQGHAERRCFRNKHDSRIFVEPFDFFHVFSGLDFSRLSLDKLFDRFEKGDYDDKDQALGRNLFNKGETFPRNLSNYLKKALAETIRIGWLQIRETVTLGESSPQNSTKIV